AFADEMPDGTAVSDQPYWPSSAGLATIHARLAAMIDAGARVPTVAVVEPWMIVENAEDWEQEAFRNVTNYLAAIQVGFNVFDGVDLQLCSEAPEPSVKAVFLPRATLSADSVGAIGALVDKGVKVIAYGDVPEVDEDQRATIEEIFGVASVDDVEDPIVQKGNAVLVPAELTRLNAMLNGMRCEDLFLYPPWPKVVSARFVSNADPTRDWYLLHNTSDTACHTYLTLYRRCVPEVWNIDSGTVHIAPGYKYTEDDTTLLPLVLESQDAIILMCTPAVPEGEDTHIVQAPGLEKVTRQDKDGSVTVTGLARLNGGHTVMLADGRKAKMRVEDLPPELLVDGAWSFAVATPFDRQASQITKARVRAERPGDDPSGWSAADLDDAVWDLATVGEDLPALAPKWHANWLASNGHDTTRYFRTSVEIGQPAKSATLTVTADNAYVVYLNGEQLGEDGTWMQAETYDIAEKLKQGENVIGVRVWNDGPQGSVLAEARIAMADGEFIRVATDDSWRVSETESDGWSGAGFDASAWAAPEVVGAAPTTSPWGDVPGLPAEPNTGRRIWFRFDVPPGATRLNIPGAEVVGAFISGETAAANGSEVVLGESDDTRRVALVIDGGSPPESPFECEAAADQILVGDWSTQGLEGYSGEATYERTITLPDEYVGEHMLLDLGEVGCAVRLFANGREVGPRSRAPFVFDLGEVRKAKLKLKIQVANTLAAAAPSGIVGPVMLLPRRLIEATLEKN
ncbi:MAG TPA: beta galactosidase jelly roll domain-containing protein, partial [Armatimonadota bacterium]|nr:beta galactosidase jelly roll domain-containing protein [Armatimonadota bacterium]